MTAHLRYDMPAEEYHKAEGLSASTCKKMATEAPAQVKWDRDHPKPSNERLILGTYSHAMILEPETLERSFMVVDKFDRKSNEAKARWAALEEQAKAEGKVIVRDTPDEITKLDSARRMRDAVQAHPEAREILAAGRAEVSVFATDPETGIALRSREDWMPDGQNVVPDLKTAADPGHGFAKAAYKFGYHIGAHHYRLCRQQYNIANGVDVWDAWPEYQWIVVGIKQPHLVAIYKPSELLTELGAQDWRRGRDAWIECTKSGVWPGLPTGVSEIDPPGWAI